jgi:WD40 repeat protein
VRYAAHYGPVNSLAVTRAGTSAGRELLLTGGDDGVARVWDPAREGKDPVVELDDGLGGVVTAVEWSADGSAAFVGGVDNEIKVSEFVDRSADQGLTIIAGVGSEKTRGAIHAEGSHGYRELSRFIPRCCADSVVSRSRLSLCRQTATSSSRLHLTRPVSFTTFGRSRRTQQESTGR